MRATGSNPARTARSQGATSTSIRRAGGHRGQTTIDFAIGMSVFLVSLAFVFAFVPGMLSPFVTGGQDELPAANRVADDLVQRTLGGASDPYELDTDCTRAFFAGDGSTECSFEDASLTEQVGVTDRTNVRVTVSGDTDGGESEILCWDDDTGTFVEESNPDCAGGSDVVLARGPDPAGAGGGTVSARRVAALGDQDVTVEVVVW